jgi:hypothetical protein
VEAEPKDDPTRAERAYRDRFERHYDALPFANSQIDTE